LAHGLGRAALPPGSFDHLIKDRHKRKQFYGIIIKPQNQESFHPSAWHSAVFPGVTLFRYRWVYCWFSVRFEDRCWLLIANANEKQYFSNHRIRTFYHTPGYLSVSSSAFSGLSCGYGKHALKLRRFFNWNFVVHLEGPTGDIVSTISVCRFLFAMAQY